MTDFISALTDMPGWEIIVLIGLSYAGVLAGLRRMLRPALVNPFDPLNIEIVTHIAPGLVGLLMAAVLMHSYTQSFFLILLFVGYWVSIIRAIGKPGKIELVDQLGVGFPVALLSLVMLVTVLNVLVNMIIPGTVPLFSAGGAAARFDATNNSRVLTWLGFGTAPVVGAVFALTQSEAVRRFAKLAVSVQMVASLLFASKSAILLVVFVLFNALFVAKARNDGPRYQMLRLWLIRFSFVIATLMPVYFGAIGIGSGSSSAATVGFRFLESFDQLILASQFDLLHGQVFGSAMGINIIELQFLPFFKTLLSTTYHYSNVGQYVLDAALGLYVEGPYTFPNSNLILEAVLTSGKYLGFLVFTFEMACFYWIRFASLRKPITPLSLVLFSSTVLNPVGLFIDGQAWMNETVLMFLVVCAALFASRLWGAFEYLLSHAAPTASLEGPIA